MHCIRLCFVLIWQKKNRSIKKDCGIRETLRKEVVSLCLTIKEEKADRHIRSAAFALHKRVAQGYILKYAHKQQAGTELGSSSRPVFGLFKLLFMRDRTHENIEEDREKIKPLLHLIQQNLGINEEEAYMFHTEMWLYVHGIATALATSYLVWNEEFISKALRDGYGGMKVRYEKGKSI